MSSRRRPNASLVVFRALLAVPWTLIGVLAAASAAAMIVGEGDLFARLGSLYVALAVAVAFWYRGIPQMMAERVRARLPKTDDDDVDETVEASLAYVSLARDAEWSAKRIEFWLGLCGTLMWGWGDLLVAAVHAA